VIVSMPVHAGETPLDRWAQAVGGQEKIAPLNVIYREATIELRGFTATGKFWHTRDGRYRKEEQYGGISRIETFDGTTALLQQGAMPPQKLEGEELRRAKSSAYANTNAIFFALSEARRGQVVIEGEDRVVMKPDGGIDWNIALDRETGLPKSMSHLNQGRVLTVTFDSYETVEGVRLEKEMHRTNGDPRFDAVIRFTKTVFNPPIEASLFTLAPK
jgi:hypothetical protein